MTATERLEREQQFHDAQAAARARTFAVEPHRLRFTDDALETVAELALQRKVGARGLRMILEDLMLDLMYYLPSYKKVREFQVTKEMVLSQKISLTLLEKVG